MPTTKSDLLAVCVDGETKTGKGAAGKAIAAALENEGYKVYYDVAGDFFRRYVAIVRKQLGLSENDALPMGNALESAARAVHDTRQAYQKGLELGDLQRPAISQSVAVLGELPFAQKAVEEWWTMTLELAKQAGSEVLVVDARNPRSRLQEAALATGLAVRTALDLFMTCDPEESARRVLRTEGVDNPTPGQLAAASEKVEQRRKRDRDRPDKPFEVPAVTIAYTPAEMTAQEVVAASWQPHPGAELPVTIQIDNTHFTEAEMLSAVTGLAAETIRHLQK